MSGGKKPKQVLLGAWLSQAGEKSNGIGFDPNSTKASSNGNKGGGAAGGGGGGAGAGWAKYEAAPSSFRGSRPVATGGQHQGHSQQARQPYTAYNKGNGSGASLHAGSLHSQSRTVTSSSSSAAASRSSSSIWSSSPVGVGSKRKAPEVIAVDDAPQGGEDIVCLGSAAVPEGAQKPESQRGASSSGEAVVDKGGAGEEEVGLPEGVDGVIEDLCEEQKHVVTLVLKGKSVFFTGAAGTGKSFLLKKLHQSLRHVGKGPGTFMTGTTGKAAVGIGGCTVHSFAGIGLGKEPVEELLGRVQRGRQSRKRWTACEVLVIDEVSMMEADLFDKLNLIGQRMRGDPRPFGGIQLVLCGDFFQLPPIGIGRGTTRFCFEARTWDTSVDESIVLKQVFRQRDPRFLKILHEMREGRVSEEAKRVLQQKVMECRAKQRATEARRAAGSNMEGPAGRGSEEEGADGNEGDKEVTFVRLFSRNDDVDRLNETALRKLDGVSEFFAANDNGDKAYLSQLQKHCNAVENLELKVGAKVLLLKNVDSSSNLVNGATGVVTEFVEASGRRLPMVEFDPLEGKKGPTVVIREEEWTVNLGSKEMAKRVQIPLRLAWALSVHKAQGMTIPHVMVSTEGMFEFGQAYVALSRATTLDGLMLVKFDPGTVKVHHKVEGFYRALEGRARVGPSRAVTAVPRQGQAPVAAGGWISRSTSHPTPSGIPHPPHPQGASSSSPAAAASSSSGQRSSTWSSSPQGARGRTGNSGGSVGGGGGATVGGISPAGRARMEANRHKALQKLAETRARALQASLDLAKTSGSPGVNGGSR